MSSSSQFTVMTLVTFSAFSAKADAARPAIASASTHRMERIRCSLFFMSLLPFGFFTFRKAVPPESATETRACPTRAYLYRINYRLIPDKKQAKSDPNRQIRSLFFRIVPDIPVFPLSGRLFFCCIPVTGPLFPIRSSGAPPSPRSGRK